jgi:hypothetical protein
MLYENNFEIIFENSQILKIYAKENFIQQYNRKSKKKSTLYR